MNAEKNKSSFTRLALMARAKDDINLISALIQDSAIKTKNIRWIKKRHRFSLLMSRFRWELMTDKKMTVLPFSRVQSMLVFDGVLKVSSKGLQYALNNEVLSLLSLSFTSYENYDDLELIFSDDVSIKLYLEFVHVLLQDFEPLVAGGKATVPTHDI